MPKLSYFFDIINTVYPASILDSVKKIAPYDQET